MKRIIYPQNITQKELGMKNLFLKRFFKLHVFILLNVIINTQSFGANIYGRLDFSLNEINKFSLGSETKAVSNSSRLGLKGKHIFENGFSAIYQYETQIDPIDRSPNFKDRNSYIGLKGYFGKFIIGIHDTPVKQSQATVDLFNDTAGDIKNILWGENRSKKAAQWNSPKVKGLTLSTMLILEQGGEEAFSTNLMWQGKLLGNKAHFSIGFDSEVPQKGLIFDTTRIAATIPIGKPLILGLIWQESKDTLGNFNDDGYVISLKTLLSKKLAFKLMYGKSDMVQAGGQLTAIGFDYKVAKPLKLYLNYIDKSYEDSSKESEHIMIGLQYNFNIEIF